MSQYVPVASTDPNRGVLEALSFKVKKYIVTWTRVAGEARAVYGIYRTQRQAFLACREASNRSVVAFPLCFLSTLIDFYLVVSNNVFTH